MITRKSYVWFLVSIGLGLLILMAVALGRPGNFPMAQTKYLAEYPGKIVINIDQKGYDQVYRIFKLLPAEINDSVRIRQRLLDLIALQPAAKPPRGVSLTCYIRAEQYVTLGKPDRLFSLFASRSISDPPLIRTIRSPTIVDPSILCVFGI